MVRAIALAMPSIVKSRPAETASGLGGVGLAAAYIAGVRDPETLTYIGVIISFIPAVVASLIDGGGIVGWASAIFRGKR